MKRIVLILLVAPLLLAAEPTPEWTAESGDWTFGRNEATCNGDGKAVFSQCASKELVFECVVTLQNWALTTGDSVNRVTISWGEIPSEKDNSPPQTAIWFQKSGGTILGTFLGTKCVRHKKAKLDLLPNKPLRVRIRSTPGRTEVSLGSQVLSDERPITASVGTLYLGSRNAAVTFSKIRVQIK